MIVAIISNGGIINKSINVAKLTNEESIKEEIELVLVGWESDYYGKGIAIEGRSEETVSKATVTYQDENNVIYEKDGETYIGVLENKRVIKLIEGEKRNVKDGVWISKIPEDNWFSKSNYYNTSFQGEGTQENPYLISSEKELAGLSYEVANGNDFDSKYFKLTKNLNMGEHIWVPIGGRKYEDIESNYYQLYNNYFNGVFDGGGFCIAGIYYNDISMTTGNKVGLFGFCNSIKSKLINVNIIDSYISAYSIVGGVVGYFGRGEVIECSNSAIIQGGTSVGGIAGQLYYGNIKNCYNIGNITLDNYNYLNNRDIRGIVGSSTGSITNVYNLGKIIVKENKIRMYIGGLVGNLGNSTIIYNGYNGGEIIVNTINNDVYVGGIYGKDASGTNIWYCFNIGNIECNEGKIGGIAGQYSGGSTLCCYYKSSEDCCKNIEYFGIKDNGVNANEIGRFETLESTDFNYYDSNEKETLKGNIIEKLNKVADTRSDFLHWKVDKKTGIIVFDR